jgi:tape measure domain-containing protein
MANILEYTLSLQDKLSAKLQQIGVNSNVALERFSKLQTQAVKVQEVMTGMGRSVSSLRDKLALLKNERDLIPESNLRAIRTYNSEIKKLEKNVSKLETINGSKFKTAMKDAFQAMPGSDFLTNPIVAGAGAIAGIIKIGMEAEQTKASFDVLLGSQQKSAEMLKQLTDYSDKTPYGKQEIQNASKMMLQFGISAESIMPNIAMIGDIAMGNADKMNSLTLAFSQVSSAGKLQGQDLLQMINAGFNPLKEISRTTGESMAALKIKMEKGAISADMVSNAFKTATSAGGLFYGMSDKMSKTIGGQLSTVLDNFKGKALQAFSLIQPLMQPALDMLSLLLNGLSLVLNPLGKFLKSLQDGSTWAWVLAGAVGAVALAYEVVTLWMKRASIQQSLNIALDKVQAFWHGAVSLALKGLAIAQWLLNAAMAANPIVWVVLAIAALTTGVVYAWNKFEGFRAVILTVWDTIKGFGGILKEFVLDRIKGIISGLGAMGSAIYKLFTGDFSGAWETAKQGVADLSGYNAVKNAISASADLVGGVKKDYQLNLAQQKAGLVIGSMPKTSYSPFVSAPDTKTQEFGFLGATDKSYIKPPVTPGAATPEKPVKDDKIKATTDAIASGGARNTSVNIKLKNMVENIVFSGGMKENRGDLEKQITQIMMRVLGMAQSTA